MSSSDETRGDDRTQERAPAARMPPPEDQSLSPFMSPLTPSSQNDKGVAEVVPPSVESVKASKTEPGAKKTRGSFGVHFGRESRLRARHLIGLVLDIAYLVIWAVLTKVGHAGLEYVHADWWIFWASYFGEFMIFLGIAVMMVGDFWNLVRAVFGEGDE
jgi:hypothetical protein